jgi:hypothetical protein
MRFRVFLLSCLSLVAGQAKKPFASDLAWNSLTYNALTYNSITHNAITLNALTFNALTQNGLFPNGLFPNGLFPNGLFPNGLFPNGLFPNGISPNGISPNGISPNGISPNGISPNGISPNGISPNGISPNGMIGNAIVANALIGNALTNNAILGNAILANALTHNSFTNNAILANAILANALVVNALTANGLGDEEATICFNVTNYNASLENCEDGTTNSLKNGTICLNVTGEPLNVTDSSDSNPIITAQELALLILSSIDNTTSSDEDEDASRPRVRMSEFAGGPLRGDHLPANMSLILSGAAGAIAQKHMVDLLNYTVSCALNTDQSVTIQVSGQPVVLNGSLGLTPNWARQRIAAADQERVSACLAARLNFFGVHVEISIRGHALPHPSAEELADYTLQEGAYWGNIFKDDEPELFACTNKSNLANSYASLRFCSNGFPVPDGSTISCGLLRNVGSCDNWCTEDAHQAQFNACGRWQQVLSVFLPHADQ